MQLTLYQKKQILIVSLALIALVVIILLVRIYNVFIGANLGAADQDNIQTFTGTFSSEGLEAGENVISFKAKGSDGKTITAFKKITVIESPEPEEEEPYGGDGEEQSSEEAYGSGGSDLDMFVDEPDPY